MDENTKKFFEELSNVSEEATSIEPVIEPVKSSTIPVREKKNAAKSESGLAELMEEGEGQLAIDVYQTPEEIIVESTIAGVDPEDLDVDITPESVTVRGKRIREKKVQDEDYFYQECYWGKFSRSIILPQEIDPENAVATLKNGVLMIKMPKLNRQKSKKLKVKFN